MTRDDPCLADFGERQLVEKVFRPRYASRAHPFGDDCAYVSYISEGALVATTDPAPRPVAAELGLDDLYHWGWLLAAINLSDLAAAGATPLGLLTSLTLPSATKRSDLERLLDGVDDCCRKAGTQVIGGNLKESVDGSIHCEATAIGMAAGGHPMSRKGARPGDLVVAFGQLGGFWSSVVAQKRRIDLGDVGNRDLLDALTRPIPQTRVGVALREAGLARACTDASDGLYGAMSSLTTHQGVGLLIEPHNWRYDKEVRDLSMKAKIDPFRLAMGFGDFQLVCAIDADLLSDAKEIGLRFGESCNVLGVVREGDKIVVDVQGSERELSNFDNERFTQESQFTSGLDSYMSRLLEQPLYR